MADVLRERAPAKVNLTLRVVARRADGYHDIESLVAFTDLADELTFDPEAPADIAVTGPFAAATGPAGENLVLKAARLMKLERGRFTLKKNIPVAAGLGGGSADAAAALRLIARERSSSTDNPRIRDAAAQCGADVPACLVPRARIMRGIGDQLSPPIELPKLAAVLVNPGVPVATRDVFAAFEARDSGQTAIGEPPGDLERFVEWLKPRGNDLARAAVSCAPVIRDGLDALQGLPGCRLVRMSGSGATCFGIFPGANEAAAAARSLAAAHPDWWICNAALS